MTTVLLDSPIQVVEERQEIEGQLDPALSLTLGERVCVHNTGGVVQTGPRHHRPRSVPVQTTQGLVVTAGKNYKTNKCNYSAGNELLRLSL